MPRYKTVVSNSYYQMRESVCGNGTNWKVNQAILFFASQDSNIGENFQLPEVMMTATVALLILITIPLCSAASSCPTLSNPLFGRVAVAGSMATYTCGFGLGLVGNSIRFCSAGKWSGSTPMCIKGTSACPSLSNPSFGKVTVDSTFATYKCNPGYRLSGSSYRICLTGTWSGATPKCTRNTCKSPSNPSFGRVVVAGSRATYSCNPGYRLAGISIRNCRIGTWSGAAPKCTRKTSTCPSLSNPSFGGVVVAGSIATYSCNPGYKLVGNSIRNCASGRWSGATPTCTRTTSICPSLYNPSFGRVVVANSKATYFCNHGYRIVGSLIRNCESGRWSGTTPTCTRTTSTCPSLSKPSFGRVVVAGSRATYSCDPGYILAGRSIRICSLKRWSGTTPRCTRTMPQRTTVTPSGGSAVIPSFFFLVCALYFHLV